MKQDVEIFDDRVCELGEGALWHPLRQQLFWFDILGCRLLSRKDGQGFEWKFDQHVSAAGWVDETRLLIASETELFLFDLVSRSRTTVMPLEADNPNTRSNDGRADPHGGFWIGTMGKQAEEGAGSVYRFHDGHLIRLFEGMTIPNAICFSPDRKFAYFTDTLTQVIQRQALDQNGWPEGSPTTFVDLRDEGRFPDGAVVDAEGFLWNAQWGSSRIARYTPAGAFDCEVGLPALQVSCPAFGGKDYCTLFATSAAEGMSRDVGAHGRTFSQTLAIKGLPEPRVEVGAE